VLQSPSYHCDRLSVTVDAVSASTHTHTHTHTRSEATLLQPVKYFENNATFATVSLETTCTVGSAVCTKFSNAHVVNEIDGNFLRVNSKQVAAVLTTTGRIAAAFYRITDSRRIFLYFIMGLEMLPNLPLFCGIRDTPNTCFIGPTRGHNPNGITIGSSAFVGLNRHTQTHRPRCTSVAISRIHALRVRDSA